MNLAFTSFVGPRVRRLFTDTAGAAAPAVSGMQPGGRSARRELGQGQHVGSSGIGSRDRLSLAVGGATALWATGDS